MDHVFEVLTYPTIVDAFTEHRPRAGPCWALGIIMKLPPGTQEALSKRLLRGVDATNYMKSRVRRCGKSVPRPRAVSQES